MINKGRNIASRYYKWLMSMIDENDLTKDYEELLSLLYDIEFHWSIPLDSNRATDGIDLRYKFADEKNISKNDILMSLDKTCSVLEMMIALAYRCEVHIMNDSDEGIRVGRWFWNMIDNMGLMLMNNDNFNEKYIREKIDIMLNRTYERNGLGGLFLIKDPSRDMRRAEIWYQMHWYLHEYLYN